jgi:hypothetical protein
MDLRKLAERFPAGDIEWRVARAGINKKQEVFCMVLAYITARAIANRLDDVVGPENWQNTGLTVHELRVNVTAIQVGISILIDGKWVTKYDVSEPTNIEPAKGGFSGAMKRAGAQWGIGRYLYHLSETFAETSETGGKGWEYARLPEKQGGGTYYWKPPQLPAWALPPEGEKPIGADVINRLKLDWKAKLAAGEKNRQTLATGFADWMFSIVGEFPIDDASKWTQQIMDDCRKRIESTRADGKGPTADVHF